MSYNIKYLWLRFDGEPGTVSDQHSKLDQDDLEKLKIVAGINKKSRMFLEY